MGYFKEDNKVFSEFIDCYYESGNFTKKEIYPSLPEPYVNIFFPINSYQSSFIKGISVKADFMEINSNFFGVRLFLKGFMQLKLTPCHSITNKILDFSTIGLDAEIELENLIRTSGSFQERIDIFQNYLQNKIFSSLSRKNLNLSTVFNAMIRDYDDPNFIYNYSQKCGKSERTILRWFTSEIGISTKLLLRIIRFHHSLSSLHYYEENGFYLKHGYFDQAHFIREFKEFTGLSPEKYRKMIQRLYS